MDCTLFAIPRRIHFQRSINLCKRPHASNCIPFCSTSLTVYFRSSTDWVSFIHQSRAMSGCWILFWSSHEADMALVTFVRAGKGTPSPLCMEKPKCHILPRSVSKSLSLSFLIKSFWNDLNTLAPAQFCDYALASTGVLHSRNLKYTRVLTGE